MKWRKTERKTREEKYQVCDSFRNFNRNGYVTMISHENSYRRAPAVGLCLLRTYALYEYNINIMCIYVNFHTGFRAIWREKKTFPHNIIVVSRTRIWIFDLTIGPNNNNIFLTRVLKLFFGIVHGERYELNNDPIYLIQGYSTYRVRWPATAYHSYYIFILCIISIYIITYRNSVIFIVLWKFRYFHGLKFC